MSALPRLMFAPSLALLAGCIFDPPIIKDMEAAYQERRKDDVSDVVRKYLPVGMKLPEALKLLQGSGFEITEFKQEGFRIWPKGKLWAYQNESHKKAALGDAKVGYSARKQYDYLLYLNLLGKRAQIVIHTDGEQVLGSRGFVYLDGM